MYHNRLLAFKICYCLGVKDGTLARDFPDIFGVACSSDYLDNIPCSRTYRAISNIFYTVIRYSELYVSNKPFYAIAGDRFTSLVKGTTFTPDVIYQDSANVEDFLCKLVTMSHQLLPAVYNEISPALDYMSFETLVRLQVPSARELEKIRYLLRRTPSSYNIYFFGSDLFNATKRDILRLDSVLRKCVSIVTGRQPERLPDTSSLARALAEKDDGYFVSHEIVMRDNKNIFLLQTGLEPETSAKILSMFSKSSSPVGVLSDTETFLQMWNQREDIHDNSAVLARITLEEVENLREKCPTLNQVLLIQIPKQLYTKVLAGGLPNVRILSMR